MPLDEHLLERAKLFLNQLMEHQAVKKEERVNESIEKLGLPREELGLPSGELTLAEYNPMWPYFFQIERDKLTNILNRDLNVSIEHVGSTAVKGLKGKPIIDIAVGFKYQREIEKAIQILIENDYTYVADVNKISKSKFFAKGQPRLYHIHLVRIGSIAWQNLIYFRDTMRSDYNCRVQYISLKENLIKRFTKDIKESTDVRMKYSRAKSKFVDIVCMRAIRTAKFRRINKYLRMAREHHSYKLDARFPSEK